VTGPLNPLNKPGEQCGPVVVIGIGSPHGDDRAGWAVIDRLSGIDNSNVAHREFVLRKASVPHDLLDWLEVHSPTHIIDASRDKVPGLRRFSVAHDDAGKLNLSPIGAISKEDPQFFFDSLRSNSTHQIGLLSTLELVAALGRLPRQLYLWTVSIASGEKNVGIGTETQERIDECILMIAKELFLYNCICNPSHRCS
jgi:hydrogenase maturation protease